MSDFMSVPEGWNITTLEKLSPSIIVGHVGSTSEHYTKEGILFLRTGNLNSGNITLQDIKFITADFHESLSKSKLKAGDVLVSRVGYTGNAAIVPNGFPDANCANIIIIRSGDDIYPKYLHVFINSPIATEQTSTFTIGSAQSVLNIGAIKKLKVFVPPFPEQKKIASILTSVDDVIEKTEAQISKLQDLKKGMMTELLTNGIGHTEFKDSPVGRIPVSWKMHRFMEVSVKIQDGTHFSPKSKDGAYKYVTSKNIRSGFLDTENIQYISKEEHEEIYKRCDVRYGDVLFTKDGANTGNSALNTFREPISLLSSVAFIRCEESKCLNSYMFQFLLSDWCQREIQDLMTGNAITRLTLEKIKNMKLPIPPITEQTKITQLINSIDSKMLSKKRKLAHTKSLKKALMNDLLTGKKRVNVTN